MTKWHSDGRPYWSGIESSECSFYPPLAIGDVFFPVVVVAQQQWIGWLSWFNLSDHHLLTGRPLFDSLQLNHDLYLGLSVWERERERERVMAKPNRRSSSLPPEPLLPALNNGQKANLSRTESAYTGGGRAVTVQVCHMSLEITPETSSCWNTHNDILS